MENEKVNPSVQTNPESKGPELSRRNFLKLSAASVGAAAVVTGAAAAGVAGYANATDRRTATGWETETGDEEYFDRKPFEVSKPTNRVVGPTRNIEYLSPAQYRRNVLSRFFDVPEGMAFADYLRTVADVNNLEATPFSIINNPDLVKYYQDMLDREGWNFFAEDLRYFLEVLPRRTRILAETEFDLTLAKAYVNGHYYLSGYHLSRISKESDFEGVSETKYDVRDPAEMTRLIKKVGRMYGSPIVRIVELNNDFAYDRCPQESRGYTFGEPLNIPSHWKYGIITTYPLSWETIVASPHAGASQEGYAYVAVTDEKLSTFIKQLGYSARPNDRQHNYEYVLPPLAVLAGVGEQGRLSSCVTPEFGAHVRLGMVVTDLPLVPDKPIDFGLQKFCQNCKICAENCPSGSISFADKPREINGRGYEGWPINTATCSNFWYETPNPTMGCRICVTVCPFTKRSNWIHTAARDVAVRDKTGISASMLTWMERAFYGTHDGEYYKYVDGSREYNVVKEMPWFFKTGDFFVEPS
ncbi:MAG: reductive dehalogenase [Gracilibacteraceae bacterium]|jgi:reductive dehalogenase|nr:reductive dehalogenase [Gracilibacteraceae bacterium]